MSSVLRNVAKVFRRKKKNEDEANVPRLIEATSMEQTPTLQRGGRLYKSTREAGSKAETFQASLFFWHYLIQRERNRRSYKAPAPNHDNTANGDVPVWTRKSGDAKRRSMCALEPEVGFAEARRLSMNPLESVGTRAEEAISHEKTNTPQESGQLLNPSAPSSSDEMIIVMVTPRQLKKLVAEGASITEFKSFTPHALQSSDDGFSASPCPRLTHDTKATKRTTAMPDLHHAVEVNDFADTVVGLGCASSNDCFSKEDQRRHTVAHVKKGGNRFQRQAPTTASQRHNRKTKERAAKNDLQTGAIRHADGWVSRPMTPVEKLIFETGQRVDKEGHLVSKFREDDETGKDELHARDKKRRSKRHPKNSEKKCC
ncbi:unnamed protein product, partial [Mesorhabditis spiculigera]